MYFLCRLIPPRPSFVMDMTPAEKEAMSRHAAYLKGQLDNGKVVAFGPVMDPKGPWGVALAVVQDQAELDALLKNDPAILANMGMRYESYPMANLVTKP